MKRHISSICLASNFVLCGLLASIPTRAQVIPDATLPVNSVVTPSGNTSIIDGGTSSGRNLFHSFQEFSVPTGGTAFFNNAANIQNIFTRVTGKNISNIDGLIRANGIANLFLLNPNGIIFGPNAQLNIGGSFLATTANSFKFADGTEFSATNPQQAPLLTVNVPVGLQFGATPGNIVNKSVYQVLQPSPLDPSQTPIPTTVGLSVMPGQAIALVGGNITIDGGSLTASGGQIELGSVGGNSLVNLTSTPSTSGFVLGYEGVANFGDIQLINLVRVDNSGIGSGRIQVQGRNVTLVGGAKITSNNFGPITGGNINVTASDSVQVLGTTTTPGLYEIFESAVGVFAPIRSTINTNTFGSGDAGDIAINTRQLIVRDGGQINANVYIPSSGNGGSLIVNASESVEVSGVTPVPILGNSPFSIPGFNPRLVVEINGASALGTVSGTAGAAGNIEINTSRLIVRDGGIITANPFAEGAGGNVIVNASDSVIVSGTSPNGIVFSTVVTSAIGAGDAGNISIDTGKLIIRDGARLASNTSRTSKGGNLTVNASESVEVRGSSELYDSLLSTGTDGSGAAGNLTIATGELIVRDRALVSVRGTSTGNAGDLNITAGNVRLDNGTLTGTTAAGERGNISIQSNSLLLRRGSSITTNATGNATGGNINISTDVLAALENSDISANSAEFRGGTVTINAQGIFGTQFRTTQTDQSDITATGANTELSGTVEINQPEVDANSGLVQLPENFSDISNQIVAGCSVASENSFVITGRGGLPEDPNQTLRSRTVWQDLRAFGEQKGRGGGEQTRISQSPVPSPQSPIIEASGWKTNSFGQIELVGNSTDGIPSGTWNNQKGCDTPFL